MIPTRRSCRASAAVLLVAAAAGCSQYHYFVNERLDRFDPELHLAPRNLASPDRSAELMLVLAFSGGGTRAAALAYGVLETLARTELPSGRALVDEVDVVSAVSGGSFTASYFGLRGRGIFEDYEERFLKKNVTLRLLAQLLFPYSWLRLASPRFNRSDLAAEYYDRAIFDGGTFRDVEARGGPLLQIQATDLVKGTRFAFTQPQFSPLCSDLGSYPVARAVAASAAVPVLLSPITLKNYAGTCGYQAPDWMTEAIETRDVTRRRYHAASHLMAYRDPRTRYVHLVDGGLSDNLGLRGPLEIVTAQGGIARTIEALELPETRQVAFVIVNAQTEPDERWALADISPGIAQVLNAVTSVQINRYNFETIELLRRSIESWSHEVKRERRAAREARGETGEPPGIDFYAIEVSFDALADEEERRFFSTLPTNLSLSDATVDRLRDAADRLLRDSPDFQRLVHDLGARVEAPPPARP